MHASMPNFSTRILNREIAVMICCTKVGFHWKPSAPNWLLFLENKRKGIAHAFCHFRQTKRPLVFTKVDQHPSSLWCKQTYPATSSMSIAFWQCTRIKCSSECSRSSPIRICDDIISSAENKQQQRYITIFCGNQATTSRDQEEL